MAPGARKCLAHDSSSPFGVNSAEERRTRSARSRRARAARPRVRGPAPSSYRDLADLVAVPSVSGRDAESDILRRLAKQLRSLDLELDLWRLDLAAPRADPRFPGWEVPRSEAWGLVATATDTVESGLPALVLQGHVEVVPPGDLTLWSGDPFTPRLRGGRLNGRGTVDMTGRGRLLGCRPRRASSGNPAAPTLRPTRGRGRGGRRPPATPLRGGRPVDGRVPDRLPAVGRSGDVRRLGEQRAGPFGGRGRIGVALDEDPVQLRAAVEEAVADAARSNPWMHHHPRRSGGPEASSPVGGTWVTTAHSGRPWRAPTPTSPADPAARARRAYGSDLRLYAAAGVPTLHYGPGDVRLAHGPDESVAVEELVTVAEALTVTLLRTCG